MAKIQSLYLECYSGISGDMTVAALLDAGANADKLRDVLESLQIGGYAINVSYVAKNGIRACLFDVALEEQGHETSHTHLTDFEKPIYRTQWEEHEQSTPHTHRGLSEISAIIEGSRLSPRAKEIALSVFRLLADAEGKIHGVPPEEVHFHEAGAVDSIVDVCAAAFCVDDLDIRRVYTSPLREGRGYVRCQHGLIPVPAPATAEVARRYHIPLQITDTEGEMVTPTGAALVAALAGEGSGKIPALSHVRTIGIGAGHKDFAHANILRAFLFDEDEADGYTDNVTEITTCMDDSTPEHLGFLMDQLQQVALDAYFTPVYMKKNRPGVELTVLCAPEKQEELVHLIFAQSSAIGMRTRQVARAIMRRESLTVDTAFGPIRMKRCVFGDIVKTTVEYESARAAAEQYQCDLKTVYQAAESACKKG